VDEGVQRTAGPVQYIGFRLVIAASIPLAIGISADIAVVFFKATDDTIMALSAVTVALIALPAFWLAYPRRCGNTMFPSWECKAELKPHIRLK
jgi:hypothetical protein